MTKTEFLSALEQRLFFLPDEEKQKYLAFYTEGLEDRIEDGMREEEAVADLGDLQAVVEAISAEQPLPALVTAQLRQSRRRAQNQTLFTVLTVIGLPFWLPLAFAALLILLSFYIVIWSMIVCLYAVSACFALCAAVGLPAGVMQCFVSGVPTGVMLMGMAITCAGLFLLSLPAVKACTVQLLRFTKWVLKRIKYMFIPKREEER